MLNNRTWQFSLLIILLTIICHNAESKREELDVNARRGFFKDLENFFSGLFKPQKKPYKANATNEIKNLKRITITINSKKLRPTYKPNLLRADIDVDLENNLNENEHLNENPVIGDTDILSKVLSLDAHDKEIQYRKKDLSSENGFRAFEKGRNRKAKNLIIIVKNKRKFICQNVECSGEELDVNTRRSLFRDIKYFFVGLFNPQKKTHTSNPTKEVKNLKIISVKINTKHLPHSSRTKTNLLRTNRKGDVQNILTENEHLNENLVIGDTDIPSKVLSLNAQDNEILYRKKDLSSENGFRTIENGQNIKAKNLIIIVTNNKKVDDDLVHSEFLSYFGLRKRFAEEDVKRTILRKEFGNACIKVAVRKCYKALRTVNDIVCKTRYNCKSSFKSTFKIKAKRSCLVEFDPTSDLLPKKLNLVLKTKVRGYKKREIQQYMTECIPHLVSEYANTVRGTIPNETSEVVPILRGGSERKCQKLMRKKCNTACNRASSQTCSDYHCGKHKNKVYKKECRRECERKYLVKSDSSDSSKSGSDSD